MLLLGTWDNVNLNLVYASGVDKTTASRLHLTLEDIQTEDSFLSFETHYQLGTFFSRRITDLYKGFQVKTLNFIHSGLKLFFLFLLKENTMEQPWDQLQDDELYLYLEQNLLSALQPEISDSEPLDKILDKKIKSGESILYKIKLSQTLPEESTLYINPIVEAERIRKLFDKISGERVSVYTLNAQEFLLVYPDFLRVDPALLEHQLRTALCGTFNLQLDWANLKIEMKPLKVLDENLLSFLYGEYSEP